MGEPIPGFTQSQDCVNSKIARNILLYVRMLAMLQMNIQGTYTVIILCYISALVRV